VVCWPWELLASQLRERSEGRIFAFVTGATRAMTENTGNSVELIRCAIARLADQENDAKDFLKSGVQAAPVTNEVLDKLVWMVGQDVHDIMCHHPGYGLNRRVVSLQRALETYKKCHKDLMEKLDEFDTASQDATLFGRPRDLGGHEQMNSRNMKLPAEKKYLHYPARQRPLLVWLAM